MKRRILITGVHGFLGQALYRYFSNDPRHFEVFGLTRGNGENKHIIKCDLLNVSKARSVLKKISPQIIYHLAGGLAPKDREMWETNVVTTKNILEFLKDNRQWNTRVVIPGSAAEYGRASAKKLIRETQIPRPVVWYGFVKWMQTKLALSYVSQGLDVVIARMFNITGEGVPFQLVVGRFAQQIVKIERKLQPKEMHTRGLNGQRDFVDINDVCHALDLIAERGRRGEIYHIASARPTKIRHLLDAFLSLAKVKGIRVIEEKESELRSFDAIGSFAKLKKISGWQPKVSFQESLQETLRSYRQKQ